VGKGWGRVERESVTISKRKWKEGMRAVGRQWLLLHARNPLARNASLHEEISQFADGKAEEWHFNRVVNRMLVTGRVL
jgi:hypothetical protein